MIGADPHERHAMISLEEAQRRVMERAFTVAAETIPLTAAVHRYAATDLRAMRTQPARDLSAMDGYAIHSDEARQSWKVVGESAAGAAFPNAITLGEAVRIFTGAVMPEGANAVIMQEDVARRDDTIALLTATITAPGKHVRPAGSDFAKNDVMVARGDRLTPAQIGLLALGGHAEVPVSPRIKVALLSTGDELVPLGSPCDDQHIPASNAAMLAALLAHEPVELTDLGLVPDRLEALEAALQAAQDADILVTIGGASVGDHDLVRPALINIGAQLDFWKVAMRPGKPLMCGTLGAQIVLGLPGNPISAYVTALLFLKPLIAAISGAANPLPTPERCTLGAALPANSNRADHIRAHEAGGVVTPFPSQDSAGLQVFSCTNALIIRPPNAPMASKGDQVLIIRP